MLWKDQEAIQERRCARVEGRMGANWEPEETFWRQEKPAGQNRSCDWGFRALGKKGVP
jgi:hypothetical protein